MRFWDGGHEQNGRDMVAVARHLEAQRVVYAGSFAGGLVAARRDVRALGVVAMDLVDRDGIGVAAATGLKRPLVGLVGDPSRCNARNNGLEANSPGARSHQVVGEG